MDLSYTDNVKRLWDAWNLRGFIILSLFLQAFLVLFASFRQRSRRSLLITSIWGTYLLADWVAAVAIGLITQAQAQGQGQPKCCEEDKGSFSQEIAAFWASFLLVHLGGPDNITSFALEDNELWIRHLFGLILQVWAAGYSFYMTIPHNNLWHPTLLVFLVGIVKYGERTRALYLASLDRLGSTSIPEADPGPDYEEASASYCSLMLHVPIQAEMTTIPSNSVDNVGLDFDLEGITLRDYEEIDLVRVGKKLFDRFKGVIVGLSLTTKDREQSRNLFLRLNYDCAFRLIEYELSFMYQVLHTKIVVARSLTGYVLRSFCFLSLLSSLIYFHLVGKNHLHRFEIGLTYALLVGAIALDVISIVKLFFSDWTLLALNKRWAKRIQSAILVKSKWSRLVFQYNMVNYCVDEPRSWLKKLAGFLHATGILNTVKIMWYSSSDKVTEDLEKFLFEELKRKSKEALTMREAVDASLQRGDTALAQSSLPIEIRLKWSIAEFQYTESLLLWHIATEICCRKEENELQVLNRSNEKRRCRVMSDYMFYLLIKQPAMLSPILGNWNVVFQDTFAEGKRFFDKYSVSGRSEALDKLAGVKAKFRPAAVKGLKSKSVFFDSCILAQQLWRLADEERWKVMDRIWAEFMCYAAVNCKPIVHAQQPSRGGELLTMSWAMMSHLGLGLHFSEEEDQAGTKMVAVK